ncbi:recombinase family protein [Streptomyces sp. RB17]|uniref:recombinase family protein n=1 Tax=Streptomyces sp. RB17 TaxID=2585197 RepID=UPI001E4EAEFC|nr:recombinase family protein [Streptomyces sp. RB17]
MSRLTLAKATVTPGDPAAIYCRISHAKDEDQTGVDRQERICRDIAERLQLRVEPAHVYVDNNRSAWQRNRKRPGWQEMLKAMGEGAIRHVIVYHPDRLMRQPKDLEELLSIADDKRILLHGEANRRDLSDPDDRFILRIEVAHACRSSDDTSRRLKDALKDKAREGRPHVGNRPYGYTSNGQAIIEHEAETVREVFRRYLDGESPQGIAQDLATRGVLTSKGKTWQPENVRALTRLDTSDYEPPSTTRPEADVMADEKDRAKLEELKQLWLTDDDFTTAEFHAMRAVVLKRIKERQRKTIKRPAAVLEWIAGPDAEANWERLEKEENYERMNAIYRFLFAAVVVRPPTRKGRGFDTDRVDIKPNALDEDSFGRSRTKPDAWRRWCGSPPGEQRQVRWLAISRSCASVTRGLAVFMTKVYVPSDQATVRLSGVLSSRWPEWPLMETSLPWAALCGPVPLVWVMLREGCPEVVL